MLHLFVEVTECRRPSAGVNTVDVDTSIVYTIGYVYEYECAEGFEYDGRLWSICKPDGTWSLESSPECTGKNYDSFSCLLPLLRAKQGLF